MAHHTCIFTRIDIGKLAANVATATREQNYGRNAIRAQRTTFAHFRLFDPAAALLSVWAALAKPYLKSEIYH